jgi:uncharacterized protein YndB with AHSA1/START domain
MNGAKPGGDMKITTTGDREVVITRSFAAGKALVWEAMTTPALIRRWLFGPPGWTMVECAEDVRVGGKYRWAWNGPDGNLAMVLHGVYREVAKPDRIVRTEIFEMGCAPREGQENVASMVFTERAGRTTMTISVLYPSKEVRDGMLQSGMEHGMAAGYAQLDEMLASSAKR